jgi:hypothetical protein
LFDQEAVLEAARAYGNFSRHQEVRDFMAAARVGEALCLLLDHPNRDVLYSVCGVLMNLSADERHWQLIAEAEGVTKLIGLLERALAGCPPFLSFMLVVPCPLQVAEVCIASLVEPSAANKIVEIEASKDAPKKFLEELFISLPFALCCSRLAFCRLRSVVRCVRFALRGFRFTLRRYLALFRFACSSLSVAIWFILCSLLVHCMSLSG